MKIPAVMTAKFNKTWMSLGIAIAVGLFAALGARAYLLNQMAAIEARGKEKQVSLVVAKHDLAKGERLGSANVAVRQIPADFAQSTGVSPDDFERLEGQRLAYPVRAGETILWSLVEARKPPTFSARLEPGRRAITVAVDEINSISGMLEPGDLIDLFVTLTYKGSKLTVPLLQRVSVMATGQRAKDDPKSGERRDYSTVTLQATQDQARKLVVARDLGKITALLRNPQDTEIAASGFDVDVVLGLLPPVEKTVPVLYGGRGARLAPEALTLKANREAIARGDALGNAEPSSSASVFSYRSTDAETVSTVPRPNGSASDLSPAAPSGSGFDIAAQP